MEFSSFDGARDDEQKIFATQGISFFGKAPFDSVQIVCCSGKHSQRFASSVDVVPYCLTLETALQLLTAAA